MKLARLAVQTKSLVVVDAVGQVGGLLDFSDETAAADGVDTAGRKEKHIPRTDIVACQGIGDAPVLNHLLVLLRSDFLRKTGKKMGPRSGVHDIPHLRLPIESGTVETGGQGVIGMDLDGQVALCVDEFKQQREDIGRSGIDLFSDKPAFELLDELRKAPSIV